MLECLSDTIDDCKDFGWQVAKDMHVILLCKMEENKVNWHDTHKIDLIRRVHAQKVHSGNSHR